MPKISQEPTTNTMAEADYLLGNFNGTTSTITRQYLSQNISPVFYVVDYGAKVDGTTNDTTAWTAAIAAANAAGGGTVMMPSGTSMVSGIVLLSHVWIRGQGINASTLSLINGSNTSVVSNFVSPDGIVANAEFVGVFDMKIYGNKGTQHATSHGINFVTNPTGTAATYDEIFDPHNQVENVYINFCYSNGFNNVGRGETRCRNVFVSQCFGIGFYGTNDSKFSDCSSWINGLQGFYQPHGSTSFTNCKSFENGTVTSSGGAGFEIITNPSVAFAGCIAQNNTAQGFLITACNAVSIQGCTSDSNNNGSGNTQGQFAGVEINNSSYCIVDVVCSQTYQPVGQVGNQGWALRVNGGSNYNDIRVTQYNQPTYSALGLLSSDSVLLNNRIYTNGQPGVVGT